VPGAVFNLATNDTAQEVKNSVSKITRMNFENNLRPNYILNKFSLKASAGEHALHGREYIKVKTFSCLTRRASQIGWLAKRRHRQDARRGMEPSHLVPPHLHPPRPTSPRRIAANQPTLKTFHWILFFAGHTKRCACVPRERISWVHLHLSLGNMNGYHSCLMKPNLT